MYIDLVNKFLSLSTSVEAYVSLYRFVQNINYNEYNEDEKMGLNIEMCNYVHMGFKDSTYWIHFIMLAASIAESV